jgi:hypothetical protein
MEVVRDITLIFSFIAVSVALAQLRFNRGKITRTLHWSFIIVMAIILIMQTMKLEFFYRTRSIILDALFWVSFAGMAVTYILLRKRVSTTRKADQ